MFLAEEAAKKVKVFFGFDIFMILFTIIIGFGVIRLIKSPTRTMFSLGFSVVCLLVFLFGDLLMVLNWAGLLDDIQKYVPKFLK